MGWISPQDRDTPQRSAAFARLTLPICIAIAVFTAIVPFFRAFFPMQLEYNEGWNVNNAAIVAHHHLLYPVRYGWTTVNYPMLSFSLVAALHRFTGDYLFTARTLSLLGLLASCLIIVAIVRHLGASKAASVLAGLLCFAIFCADANMYVGVDDPQMFAQAFFLLGLLIYVRNRTRAGSLALAAALFVLGGFIKHNLVDIPLAVLLDLLFFSVSSALWFSLCGLTATVIGIGLTTHFGGPYFLCQLTAARGYSVEQIAERFITVWGPLIPALACALYMAVKVVHHAQQRIAAIFFATSMIVDLYFSGGFGVSINAYFSSLLAGAILLGLLFSRIENAPVAATPPRTRRAVSLYTPLTLFILVLIPTVVSGNWNPFAMVRQTIAQQRQFNDAVSYLKSHPGPALCEDLLLCYDAQKPYIYDPFNATRLIDERKLDATPVLTELQQHTISAVQLDEPLETCESCKDRFTPALLAALQRNYAPSLRLDSAIIYTPKASSHQDDDISFATLALNHRHRPSSSHASPAASAAPAGLPSHPARG